MKEMKKSIVDETAGTLAAELESQELGEVNGGGSPAVISAITVITALSHILNKGINEYFDSMKGMIALSEDDNKYEYEQWKESGLLLCESFEEAENLVSERKMAGIPEV